MRLFLVSLNSWLIFFIDSLIDLHTTISFNILQKGRLYFKVRLKANFYKKKLREDINQGDDPVFARFGSGALYLERREIFEILLDENFR